MKIIFALLGLLLIVAGIVGGLYVAFYQGWYKGIVGIIEACQTNPVNAGGVAFGVIRCLLASFAGSITTWVGCLFGGVCIAASK